MIAYRVPSHRALPVAARFLPSLFAAAARSFFHTVSPRASLPAAAMRSAALQSSLRCTHHALQPAHTFTRTMLTQLHARSVAPAPSSLQMRAPLPWSAASASVGRRGYAEEKIKRERQAWEEPEEEEVFDDEGRRLYGEQATKWKEMKAEQEAEAKREREKNRTSMNVQEDREAGTRDQAEILRFLTKLGLQDHAEKFFSMQNLLHIKGRELKAMGLTVKQRKTLLRLIDKYKLSLRIRKANALIHEQGATLEPEVLQRLLYTVMYGHVSDELEVRAANKVIEAAWRKEIADYRDKRKLDHSNLRGLREPEIMELAKVEAQMMAETLKWTRAGYMKQSERFKKEGMAADGSALPGSTHDPSMYDGMGEVFAEAGAAGEAGEATFEEAAPGDEAKA